MRADFLHALRRLAKSPGFSTVAVLSIALGLAANTAVFSFVLDVYFRPLPLADPDTLVLLWTKPPDPERDVSIVSADNFSRWQSGARSFASISAMKGQPWILSSATGATERARGVAVSAEFFEVFRLTLRRGRGFVAGDFRPGDDRVAVLTHRFWQRYFGGDPGVIGQTIRLSLETYTVIGVLAPENTLAGGLIDVFTPLVTDALPAEQRAIGSYFVHARLKPGVSRAQAQTEMNVLGEQLARAFPDTNRGHGISVRPIQEWIGFGPEDRRSVLVLFVAVGCVQLIVCANLANLLLARAISRRREVAVRAALGATFFQLVRPFLAEALLLSAAGGLVGLVLACWLAGLLVPLMPALAMGQTVHVSFDTSVAGFALGASSLTALVFGLLPAWQSKRVDLNEVLKEGTRGGTADTRRRHLGAWLVSGEIAVAVMLVVASGLTIQTLVRLQRVPLGFAAKNLAMVSTRIPQEKYREDGSMAEFYANAIRKTAALPGVASVALTSQVPVWSTPSRSFAVAGRAPLVAADRPSAQIHFVSPGYCATFSIPVINGRVFSENDRMGAPRVAFVNQAFAAKFFPGVNPIGQQLLVDLPVTGRRQSDSPAPWEIVGVCGNVKPGGYRLDAVPVIFLPFAQRPAADAVLVVRTHGRPDGVLRPLRQTLVDLDRDVLADGLTTMDEVLGGFSRGERHRAWLLGGFGLLALFLAGLGVYGVMSYSVNQRTRDIGIRLALGAQPADVLRMILRQGATMAATGVSVGFVASLAVGRVFESLLFGVGAIDPWSLGGAVIIMTVVALVACWLPARRATRVNPTEALRAE